MQTYEPSECAREILRYLDCSCEVFPPLEDDEPLCEAYQKAREEGRAAGFTPVLLTVDETLWECMAEQADPDSGEAAPSPARVRAYRERVLQEAAAVDGAAFLAEQIAQRKAEYEEDEEDAFCWQELLGEMEGGYAIDRLTCFWPYASEKTAEVILARIPTVRPWEIFAWLPMGNWNECPDTPELIAVARHWYERCGAVPAALTHDELEFYLEAPVTDAQAAEEIALEHYAFCPDRVEQCEEDGSVGKLADTLRKSKIWYFWWD